MKKAASVIFDADSVVIAAVRSSEPCRSDGGLEQLIELEFNHEESSLFHKSVSYIRKDLRRLADL